MSYTMLRHVLPPRGGPQNGLEQAAVRFLREDCEGLRFDLTKATTWEDASDREGTSLGPRQIPFNQEKDIDRLCLENAVVRFLHSGRKEDAFDVYFCYLEMFVGDYEKTRRMIELLSEFEANGSGLLMKHRDHYAHSVYVFVLGLALYGSNERYRQAYRDQYGIADPHQAACHYLQFWGMAALFHDIGYPFELPFEQVASYFEVEGDQRQKRPFVAYQALQTFTAISAPVQASLKDLLGGREFATVDQLFACLLAQKLGTTYGFTQQQMEEWLAQKPTHPEKFNHFMDHAYFSAAVLFHKMFDEMGCPLRGEHLDALTAILMHNSLYKFCIAHYKDAGNQPLRCELHPLAYMLMLCDELQCWDRTAYGRNSKKELHPMGCSLDFSANSIRAVYLFDEKEIGKINAFKDAYIAWLENPVGKAPALKAFSGMFIRQKGICEFQRDIQRIVDLSQIPLVVETGLTTNRYGEHRAYLSDSNFINLYHFAIVLNGRWNNTAWKNAKNAGREEAFLRDPAVLQQFSDSFKALSLEYKLSNINQAKAFARYMNEIGCFYTDKPVDFPMVEHFTRQELQTIGLLEHQRWLQEHYDMGWVYGTPARQDRERLRQHKDMIPSFPEDGFVVTAQEARDNYNRLDKAEQDKDTDPMECMLAMLRMFDGLRIYRLR